MRLGWGRWAACCTFMGTMVAGLALAPPALAKPKPPPHVSRKQAAGKWKGTLSGDAFSTVPGNSCTSSWQGPLALVVRSNGAVSGTGQENATKAPACTQGFTGVAGATHANLTVAGRFTGRAFQLQFTATSIDGFDAGFHVLYYPGPPTVTVQLTGKKSASGTIDLANNGPEELRGGGGSAHLAGKINLRRGT